MKSGTIRVGLASRLDQVRVNALPLRRLTIELATCIMLVAALCVECQYVASNNYEGGDHYYDLISPQLAYNMDQADLESSPQDQRPQVSQAIANDWLVNSLVDRWLKSQEGSSSEADRGAVQEANLDSMAESGDSMKRQSGQGEDNTDRDRMFYNYDANIHLPANSPYELAGSSGDQADELSNPVNDPEEFEAKLGQLTDSLNHEMSNTQARERLLLSLLNSTSSPTGQPVVDVQLMADDRALGELQQDDNLIHELGEYLQLKLDELKGQSKDAVAEPRQALNDVDFDASSGSTGALNVVSQGYQSSTPESRYGGSEYIDHPLALVGHQYVQGGAGEGRQLLGPDGTFENVQVIKTDTAIPSYCDPPNPCPIGYTAKDGCLENFINSASFSREYQAKQKCSCDNEHSLFRCTAPRSSAGGSSGEHQTSSTDGSQAATSASSGAGGDVDGNELSPTDRVDTTAGLADKLDTLARTIQNRYGDLASVQKLVGEQQDHQGAARNNQNQLLDDNNYLVRSARKWSPEHNLPQTQLD